MHKHQGTFETRHSFQKVQGVHTTTKIERKDINKPALTTKTCHASFPLIISSHHIPLLCCHGPSTVRRESTHAVTAGLSVATPTTRPHAFPGTTGPGPCDSLVPPSPNPNPARQVRDHVTRPMQPDDVQRICCTCCLPEMRWKTHFRLPTKLRLHSPTLDSSGSPFSILPPNSET